MTSIKKQNKTKKTLPQKTKQKQKQKNQEITSTGEDVEKRKPSCTISGNLNWYTTVEDNRKISQNIKNRNNSNSTTLV